MIKIKKNNHKSFNFPSFTMKKQISGNVEFIGDFYYHIEKQKDSNKLIGLSDNFFHHQDSIRLGWRWSLEKGKIEIVVIIYSNKIRSIIPIDFIEENLKYDFKIEILNGYYKVNFNEIVRYFTRTSKWSCLRYKLNPYFGGITKAPKDFSFIINFEYL
jgi:hypothetical protein